jgi:hypothetical protein
MSAGVSAPSSFHPQTSSNTIPDCAASVPDHRSTVVVPSVCCTVTVWLAPSLKMDSTLTVR